MKMTQLEIYKDMRKMLNRSAIVFRGGRRVYTVDGMKYPCVKHFINTVVRDLPTLQRMGHKLRLNRHAMELGLPHLEDDWFTSLDDDMTTGMAERSKFIDKLIKIAENEK